MAENDTAYILYLEHYALFAAGDKPRHPPQAGIRHSAASALAAYHAKKQLPPADRADFDAFIKAAGS